MNITEENIKKIIDTIKKITTKFNIQDECLEQDALINIYENIDKFDETKSKLETFVFNLTKNFILNQIKYKNRKCRAIDMNAQSLHDNIPISNTSDENKKRAEMINDVMNFLSIQEQNVLQSLFWNDNSLREAGTLMGLSYAGVAKIRDRAFEKIKPLLLNKI